MPKFDKTSCSQCGREFGPGDSGYSHCEHHHKTAIFEPSQYGGEVATITSQGDSILEVVKAPDGRFRLVIHNRVGETDRWEDLSVDLLPVHFAALGSIAAVKP